MRAIVLQNPHAGLQPAPLDSVLQTLRKEGFTINHLESPSREHLREAIRKKTDLIVLIGGDGTVRHFVKHFHPLDIPLLIVPTGTANNISYSLHLPRFPFRIDLSREGGLLPFRLGKVVTVDRSNFFLESVGAGMLARMMFLMHFRKLSDPYFYDYQQEKYEESLHLLRSIIHSQSAQHCRLLIDGEDHSGEYLLVEVLNTPMVGPNIHLAPEADPGDEYLDVVWLQSEERQRFETELLRRLNRREYSLNLPSRRCSSVELSWEGADIHIDGEAFKDYENKTLRLSVSSEKLHFYKGG